ncbi:MAG: hypothetical protein ACK53L_13495, partial [Pirellulaceae bacterium]
MVEGPDQVDGGDAGQGAGAGQARRGQLAAADVGQTDGGQADPGKAEPAARRWILGGLAVGAGRHRGEEEGRASRYQMPPL